MDAGRTQLREVKGSVLEIRPDGSNCFQLKTLVFRITKDQLGKSISLCDEERGIMLEIPLEPVEDMF